MLIVIVKHQEENFVQIQVQMYVFLQHLMEFYNEVLHYSYFLEQELNELYDKMVFKKRKKWDLILGKKVDMFFYPNFSSKYAFSCRAREFDATQRSTGSVVTV